MAIFFQGKYGFTVKSLIWWIRMTAILEFQKGKGLDTQSQKQQPWGGVAEKSNGKNLK